MLLVALPLSLHLDVAASPHQSRPHPGGAWQALGAGVLTLPGSELPEAQWYVTEQGYLLGVGATSEPQAAHAEIAAITGLQPLLPQGASPAQPWVVAHDLKRLETEMMLAHRLCSELSLLLALWEAAETQDPADMSPLLAVDMAGDLRIRPEVIRALQSGLSLYDIAGHGVDAPPADGGPLRFGVRDVVSHSPLNLALQAYVTSDGPIRTERLLDALALLMQVVDAPPPADDTASVQIRLSLTCAELPISAAILDASVACYAADLATGGLRTAQHFLLALGFDPGPLDGVGGDATDTAAREFCQTQSVVCTSPQSLAFNDVICRAMAQRFPVVDCLVSG